MVSRGARSRVCFTDNIFLSMSERTLPRLKCQFKYCFLLDALNEVYGSTSSNPSNSLDLFPGVLTLLEERCEGCPRLPSGCSDQRFGYSARDVSFAIFSYTGTTKRHKKAFDLESTELLHTVSALSELQATLCHIGSLLSAQSIKALSRALF